MFAQSVLFFAFRVDSHDPLKVVFKTGVLHVVEEVDFEVILHHLKGKSQK